MIMQVHDELVFEIKESDLQSLGIKICDLMIGAENLNVPLVVNTFNGNNWREG
jgi:DNA polymerase-1